MAERFSTAQFSPLKLSKDDIQPARLKIFHHKARTGCRKCKERRVKCDETKPACIRCQKAGYPCSGYNTPKTRLFGLNNHQCFMSDFEKICFESFIDSGAAELSSFQPAAKPFWVSLAPQLSQIHPSIRHCLIAISVLQEPVRQSHCGQAAYETGAATFNLCLAHFNRAIQSFNAEATSLPLSAMMTCCILFTALSIYTENVGFSTVHSNALRRMILSHQDKVETGQELKEPLIDLFKPINRRLLLDCSTFSDEYNLSKAGDQSYIDLLVVPDHFENLGEAYETLSIILQHVFSINDYAFEIRRQVEKQLFLALTEYVRIVESSFPDRGVGSGSDESPSSDQSEKEIEENGDAKEALLAKMYLSVHHRVATIMLKSSASKNALRYDPFTEDFDFILKTCCTIIDIETCARTKSRKAWSLSLGILPPLFFVATCCRDKDMRIEALEVLHNSSRSERGWSSCMAFSLARIVVQREEDQRIPGDTIPAYARIMLTKAIFSCSQSTLYVEYTCDGQDDRVFQATAPYNAHPAMNSKKDYAPLSQKMLRAHGYTSPVLYTPSISCHCVRQD